MNTSVIEKLIQRAEEAHNSHDSLHFSQAALNAANALAKVQEIKNNVQSHK